MNQFELITKSIEKTVKELGFMPDPKSTEANPIYNHGVFNISYEKEGEAIYLWFGEKEKVCRLKCKCEVDAKICLTRIKRYYQSKTA